jgi:hypothetical protein
MKKGVSYFGVRNPKWVLEDMKEILACGYTHVLHTYSETDFSYYQETMEKIIQDSVDLGLKVYVNPWGIGRVFGGEAFSELVGKTPSMAQKTVDGAHKIAACPNQKAFRDYMHQWIEVVCKTSIETVFWDEPHFYFEKRNLENWACRCELCQSLFEKQYGYTMPQNLSHEVLEFRENSLLDFLKEMTYSVCQKGKRNSVCLLPYWFPAGIENWDKIAQIPYVDEISSDPYWEKTSSSEDAIKNYQYTSNKLFDLCQKYQKEAQIWIKNYHIVAGKENDIVNATKEAYLAGIRNIFAWSFRGSEYLSWLRSDNPELVWKTQCEALQNLK